MVDNIAFCQWDGLASESVFSSLSDLKNDLKNFISLLILNEKNYEKDYSMYY